MNSGWVRIGIILSLPNKIQINDFIKFFQKIDQLQTSVKKRKKKVLFLLSCRKITRLFIIYIHAIHKYTYNSNHASHLS